MYLQRYGVHACSDVNKDLGPKAKAKDRWRKANDLRYQGGQDQGLKMTNVKANVQRKY